MGRAALCAVALLLAAAAEPLLDALESPTGPPGMSPAGRARETWSQEAPLRECPAGQTTAQHRPYRLVSLDYIWVGIPAMAAAFIGSFCVPYAVFRIRDWWRFRKLLRTLNDQLQLAQTEHDSHVLDGPAAPQGGTTARKAVTLSGTCTIRISNENLSTTHTLDP